jgi:hypothetical protein
MQSSKRETHLISAHLPFPICETRLFSVRLLATCAAWFRSLVSPRLLEVMLSSF